MRLLGAFMYMACARMMGSERHHDMLFVCFVCGVNVERFITGQSVHMVCWLFKNHRVGSLASLAVKMPFIDLVSIPAEYDRWFYKWKQSSSSITMRRGDIGVVFDVARLLTGGEIEI